MTITVIATQYFRRDAKKLLKKEEKHSSKNE